MDAYEVYRPARPRKFTGKELAEARTRQEFAAETVSRARPLPREPQILGPGGICVLNERGGHLRIGKSCPHGLLELDADSITDVG